MRWSCFLQGLNRSAGLGISMTVHVLSAGIADLSKRIVMCPKAQQVGMLSLVGTRIAVHQSSVHLLYSTHLKVRSSKEARDQRKAYNTGSISQLSRHKLVGVRQLACMRSLSGCFLPPYRKWWGVCSRGIRCAASPVTGSTANVACQAHVLVSFPYSLTRVSRVSMDVCTICRSQAGEGSCSVPEVLLLLYW